ncbi:MAG: hypothetical protein KGZ42_06750 [Melioribacter sp.]|nr:hypothetical protein [Melioribacter sp.]
MKKYYRMSIQYSFLLLTIIFYSCGNKQNQTDNLSPGSNPEEYAKIDVKLGKRQFKISLNYKVNKQLAKKRKFVDIETKHLFNIGSIQDTIFSYPVMVKSDKSGNIYVLDMQGCSVSKFDSNGSFVKKYGRKGKGPGEFDSPFRIDVSDNGKLLVLDPNLMKCELFEGDNTKQFILSMMSHAACFVDSTSFVTFQTLMPFDYSALIKHNISNGSSEECQNLIMANDAMNIGALPFLSGEILSVNKNGFLYVPEFMNHFVKYSNEGKIIDACNTIENIKLPSIQRENPNIIDYRLPKENISSYNSFVITDRFFNVSYQASIKGSTGRKYVIDVYSISSGVYLHSFMLPEKVGVIWIYMDKEKIYLLKDNLELEVLRYKLDE